MEFLTKTFKFTYQVGVRRLNKPMANSIQYFLKDDKNREISSWSQVDIKLDGDNVTIVTQIPKQISAKMQMIKQLPNHPIMQDTRTNMSNNKIQLRHYALPLPLINYGFIPMTWQQTLRPDQNGFFGDDDPIDILDLSQKQRKILDVSSSKVLGSFCLIDEGQLDWKILTIDPEQAEREKISSYLDIPQFRLKQIIEWFMTYKTYDGKPYNTLGFNGEIFNKQQTLQIIYEAHKEFIKLKEGNIEAYAVKKKQFNL